MPRRQVADTPLAQAIDELITLFGSDQKLADAVGNGATRFAVMAWRKGRIPEKSEYVGRLIELGVDAELFLRAREDDLASRKEINRKVEGLEAEVDDLADSTQMVLEVAVVLVEQVEALGGQVPAEMLDALRQAIAGRPA